MTGYLVGTLCSESEEAVADRMQSVLMPQNGKCMRFLHHFIKVKLALGPPEAVLSPLLVWQNIFITTDSRRTKKSSIQIVT